ncbi:hypothetical protein L484_014447 [Morus notabilis]|uniref:Uncharacterized protein n=1 Tax=Morus notabilis TaxID=981085 RepID=W9QUD8_9ROSA|nr:hypothetical protein L484_014447 [Morus notabilis]
MRLSAVDLQKVTFRDIVHSSFKSSVAISPSLKSVTGIFQLGSSSGGRSVGEKVFSQGRRINNDAIPW